MESISRPMRRPAGALAPEPRRFSRSKTSEPIPDLRGDKEMVRAFKLYTGADGASHVLEGAIDEKDRTDVTAIHFKETPAHSAYDWHPDPEPQFVITLSGSLEFG